MFEQKSTNPSVLFVVVHMPSNNVDDTDDSSF